MTTTYYSTTSTPSSKRKSSKAAELEIRGKRIVQNNTNFLLQK
jgi:hypothetical protein